MPWDSTSGCRSSFSFTAQKIKRKYQWFPHKLQPMKIIVFQCHADWIRSLPDSLNEWQISASLRDILKYILKGSDDVTYIQLCIQRHAWCLDQYVYLHILSAQILIVIHQTQWKNVYVFLWCNRKSHLAGAKERVAGAPGDNENLMRKQRTELRLALFLLTSGAIPAPDNLMTISTE